ncbi:MAG: outer membrane beta-barrel protein [Bacteroidia bacterium]
MKGTVTDSTKAPVAYCAIALLNAKDSSLVKGNISDSTGQFVFENIKLGSYFVKFSSVGYNAASTQVFILDSASGIDLPPQVLSTSGVNLKEVSVAAYKPAIEFKKGTVVMNVENDLLARGNTVLELLKRVPGVIIDAQNNITINGIGGAKFLIDDRLQQMPGPQVIDMLSSMSADAISKIELIKNPPARYDAAGTGGLINIVTKKAKVKGFNGVANFGISQGKRLRFGPFVSLNYKSNKLSIFSNFSFGHWDGINVNELDRTLTTNGNTEAITSYGATQSFQKVLSGNGGIEYDITKKTMVGFYFNGNFNNDYYLGKTETFVTNDTTFNYNKLVYTTNDKYNISSPSYNLSLLQKIDSTGGELKFNVGYNNLLEKNTKLNENHFYDLNNVEVAQASIYNNYADRNYKVFTQKMDLNKAFKNKLSLEAGWKSSFVDNYNLNELHFSNHSTGSFVGDTIFYNSYHYKERILAGYTTIARSWDKFGFSVGLRAEETDIHANDLKTSYHFDRNYFNVFPSGSIDITLNKKNTITTAYSYRIDRPHYGMLNPIRVFNEQLNYGSGNPTLRPQYTDNITIDHNYNQFITQSVGLNRTKDFTYWYSYTPNGSKVNVDTIFNFPWRYNYYYSLSAQKRIKWYSFQAYAVIMYRTFSGQIYGTNVNSETWNYYANCNQEFYLPKDFKIQLWAGYGSGFKDGPQYYFPRSAVHLSIHKAFLDKKLNVMVGIFDIFYKDYQPYSSTLTNQYFYWTDKFDTRRVRLTMNYRFGKMRIEQRVRNEEDSRLKSGK